MNEEIYLVYQHIGTGFGSEEKLITVTLDREIALSWTFEQSCTYVEVCKDGENIGIIYE